MEYEDDEYQVKMLPPSTPDNEYGVKIKQTGEFAIYAAFYEEAKEFKSIYRSDENFKLRESSIW